MEFIKQLIEPKMTLVEPAAQKMCHKEEQAN